MFFLFCYKFCCFCF
uniref:Uncharacterized protein n=1 Tax=Anguilla anguilla TaxID=7936 RepID=A0A0E9UAT9_ANGAN